MFVRVFVSILIVGLSGLFAASLRTARSFEIAMPTLDRLAAEIGPWRSVDLPVNEEESAVLAADRQLDRCYERNDGTRVWLFIAYFGRQQVNTQIHSPRNCIPGAGWKVASIDEERLPLGSRMQTATKMHIASNRGAYDVLYWFRTQSGSVSGEYALKWDLVKNSLARRPTNAAFVRFHAESKDEGALRELAALLSDPMDDVLGQVGLR